MEAQGLDLQANITAIIEIIITGFLIPLALAGIRWLQAKATQNAFFSKLKIDDTLFEVAEDVVRVHVPDLGKAFGTLDGPTRRKMVEEVIARMQAHGVNIANTHGTAGIQEVLTEALSFLKVEKPK